MKVSLPPLQHSASWPAELCPARCRRWSCRCGRRSPPWCPGGCSSAAPPTTRPWKRHKPSPTSNHHHMFIALQCVCTVWKRHLSTFLKQLFLNYVASPYLGFSWASISRMTSSIHNIRSRTMLKKRNLSPVSTSFIRRPSAASSRFFQASSTWRGGSNNVQVSNQRDWGGAFLAQLTWLNKFLIHKGNLHYILALSHWNIW